jgi:hypothetical protein
MNDAHAYMMFKQHAADRLANQRPWLQSRCTRIRRDGQADLLLVEGDPIVNIKVLEDPAKNLVVMMKDGKVYKNSIGGEKPK